MNSEYEKFSRKHRALYSIDQLNQFYKAFTNCDLDKSGEISKKELETLCEEANYPITEGSLDFIFKVKKYF